MPGFKLSIRIPAGQASHRTVGFAARHTFTFARNVACCSGDRLAEFVCCGCGFLRQGCRAECGFGAALLGFLAS